MVAKQEVSSFIRAAFRSVWALELLLFLRQHQERSWTHSEMVAGLRGSELVVTQSVDSLLAAGLIVVDEEGAARYSPVSGQVDKLVAGTEAMYGKSPDAVRRMIIASARNGITAFADSFRLRRD